jgi:flagellar biosynthetic protein FliR
MTVLVLALRGAAAIAVLTTFGGLPRIVRVGLAAVVGLWSAFLVASSTAASSPPLVDLVLAGARELAIGAAIGVVAVVPLVVADTVGRLVDLPGNGRGTYRNLFGILAAAVFVGIDGHVIVVTTLVESFRDLPALATAQPRVLASIGTLVASAVRLAIPFLITAAVVEIAVGVGMRLAGRAGTTTPSNAAVPAALVMMTAALVSTFAVAFARLIV